MNYSTSINDALWTQFGASLDMLENAVNMCTPEVWDGPLDFWYISYHCLFWTDYYLSTEPAAFQPPAPYDLSEFDPAGIKPGRVYTKAELLNYIEHCRQKANRLILSFTAEALNNRWINERKDFTLLEMLLYNMRHIQHHTGQLSLLLRQAIDNAPGWVSQAKKLPAF